MHSTLRRYPLPISFIVAFCAVSAVYAYGLGPAQQRSVVATTATNLVNLRSDPFGTMIASAFVAEAVPWMWVVLAIVGLFPVAHRFGNVRTLALVGGAQVVGTLISEGLLAWRISTGAMPASMRYLDDVGPSYVIASALIATMLYGAEPLVRTARHGHRLFDRVPSRWWRIGAGLALAFLAPHLFSGLDRLGVAAVGHVVALLVGALVGLIFARRERAGAGQDGPGEAGPRALAREAALSEA
ncbi:rhomboid-like protein [Actinoallomurus sp. NPDC052308]|uniref:rhomboid-like protein n=1 Tax=Actinoallomurus sp. NPDC052308 TaxID=3155530 RepID=UPI00341F5536